MALFCATFVSQIYADGNFSPKKGQVAKPKLAAKQYFGLWCLYVYVYVYVWLLGQANSWKEEKGDV